MTIVKHSNPLLTDLSAEFQEEMKVKCNSEGGSMILSYPLKDSASISFTAWLGKASVRPLINTQLRSYYMSLLGVSEAEISMNLTLTGPLDPQSSLSNCSAILSVCFTEGETCKKIKEEDQINSQRSRELNPQYIAKHGPPKQAAEPKSEEPEEMMPEPLE